uniref:Uncharacterized protein n=1 Tax=Sphaerodactylus townsendi TaxID=933632 RepID=A0ACB8FZX5_9SAUR
MPSLLITFYWRFKHANIERCWNILSSLEKKTKPVGGRQDSVYETWPYSLIGLLADLCFPPAPVSTPTLTYLLNEKGVKPVFPLSHHYFYHTKLQVSRRRFSRQ